MLAKIGHRVGFAVGGALLDPLALAGSPSIKRLQPLVGETRSKKRCNFSSMHRPMVLLVIFALGSICHHLHTLHNPHSLSAIISSLKVDVH
jgi:hypothetical protein